MKVLLIWPKGMKQQDWAVFPLSLGYLQNSVECSLLDCAIDPLTDKEFIRAIAGYEVIGISVWGFNLRNVLETMGLIRRYSDATLIAGGPSAHLVQADYIVSGEGEHSFLAIVDSLRGKITDLPTKINSQGIEVVSSPFEQNLDIFGVIDYQKLQLGKYLENGFKDWMYTLKDKFRSAPLMSTRGCPYNCSYCQGPVIMGHKVRKHSVAYIVQMIETLYLDYDVRQMSFLDDNLTFDREWFLSLCVAIIGLKERKGYQFNVTTLNGVRVNRLDDEILGMMKRAGWSEIVIAPESGSEATLARMRKTIQLEDVDRKIELIHKHRMNVAGYFLVGYPGDSVADLRLTRDYILGSGFDRCIINFFNPTPGTPIFEELVSQGIIDRNQFVNIDYKRIAYITDALCEQGLLDFQKAVIPKTRFKEMWIRDL